MTHAEIVKRIRELGIYQCKGMLFKRDNNSAIGSILGCCELGLLVYAEHTGWITQQEKECMISKIEDRTNKLVSSLNDNDNMTWDDFTKIVDEP